MMGQNVEHLETIILAAAGRDRYTEDDFFTFVMSTVIELEGAAAQGLADGPADEAAGNGDDVGLGVAAIDAERVELEQLARVVLVESPSVLSPRSLGRRSNRLPVVEIKQHRGILGGGEKQVVKFAEDVGPDRIAL